MATGGFYTSLASSKNPTPLAKIWLASHLTNRLTKLSLLQLSIPKTIPTILKPESAPSLRVSGQLLLGVVRIYSKKAKYLYDDCGEALQRLKGAFWSTGKGGEGRVDMTEEQERVDNRAITLRQEGGGLNWDLGLDIGWNHWDPNALASTSATAAAKAGPSTRQQKTANQADITLPDQMSELGAGELTYDNIYAPFGGGGDLDLDFAGSGGIGSQDYGGSDQLDLGLLDVEGAELVPGKGKGREKRKRGDEGLSDAETEEESVGVGRDAPGDKSRKSALDESFLSAGANMGGIDLPEKSADTDLGLGGEFDLGLGPEEGVGAPMDLDLGLGEPGLDLGLEEPPQAPALDEPVFPPPQEPRGSREQTPQPEDSLAAPSASQLDVTPRTAARINAAAQAKQTPKEKAEKKQRRKKQVVDTAISLGNNAGRAGRQGGGNREERIKKGLLTEPQYLPRSRVHLRLLEIQSDPMSYWFPRPAENYLTANYLFAPPPGLAPELQQLYRIPLKRRRVEDAEKQQEEKGAKRARSDVAEELESEIGRREGSIRLGIDDATFDLGIGIGGEPSGSGFDDIGPQLGDITGPGFDLDIQPEGRGAGAGISERGDVEEQGEEEEEEMGGVQPPGRRRADRKGKGPMRPKSPVAVSEMDWGDLGGPIDEGQTLLSIFDIGQKGTQSFPQTSQSQVTPEKGEEEDSAGPLTAPDQERVGGWSKNTIKALQVLKSELSPPAPPETAKKTLSFDQVSRQATRRAASSFFFELLVLNSRDCVKVDQEEPYGDINVQARPKLWELVGNAAKDGVDVQPLE